MTANRNFLKWAAAASVAGAALLGAGAAQARSDVLFNVGVNLPAVGVNLPGVGISVGNAPVYYAPQPVYYAPPPVYYRPAPVYYQPAPVYYQPRPVVAPGYYGNGWRGHGRHHDDGYGRVEFRGGYYR